MKGTLSILQIVGIAFSLIFIVGAIVSFVKETKINIGIEEKKIQVLEPCDFYGCNRTGEKRCSSEGIFGNVETCEFDPIHNCLRWNTTEYCSLGCKNATCKEKLPPEPCDWDGCSKTGERTCKYSDWAYVCKLDVTLHCLRWEFNQSCPYGCENGFCKEKVEVNITPTITKYIVTRVIDGDTVELNTGERVRLILIDAPESGEECYLEAKTRLQQLVLNKEVRLEKDVSETDRYGRLLRYVYVDNIFVNYQLVREGLAYAYPYPPDIKYQAQIEQAEQLAKQEAKGCLWLVEEKTCSYSLSITPSSGSYQDSSYSWSITARDYSTGEGCPSEITYTITKSESGECGLTSVPSSITIPKSGSKIFNAEVSRSGNSCSLTISIKDINGIERARGNYLVELTSPPTPENCIYISNFHYDAEGDDRYNLNDEYVVFNNKCNVSFDLTSWTINDEANHVYTFPTFILNPLASFTLYTGSGTDTNDKLYWNSGSPIWNNDHDTLFMNDTSNKLILRYSY